MLITRNVNPSWLFHQSPPQENVHVLFKIGILGNLPIAHNSSLWVLEVMFIEKKFEFEEVLHCTYGV
jgi:hypothetical protein